MRNKIKRNKVKINMIVKVEKKKLIGAEAGITIAN